MTKPSEVVNVQHMVDGVDEAIALDRRKFIKGVGFAILTAQCLSLIACASGHSASDGNKAADNLIIHSSSGTLSHVHDLLIPYAFLHAPPPQGVELKTTQAMFHMHPVALTQEQLITVKHGGTVNQKAGSHIFVIALAQVTGSYFKRDQEIRAVRVSLH